MDTAPKGNKTPAQHKKLRAINSKPEHHTAYGLGSLCLQ